MYSTGFNVTQLMRKKLPRTFAKVAKKNAASMRKNIKPARIVQKPALLVPKSAKRWLDYSWAEIQKAGIAGLFIFGLTLVKKLRQYPQFSP